MIEIKRYTQDNPLTLISQNDVALNQFELF